MHHNIETYVTPRTHSAQTLISTNHPRWYIKLISTWYQEQGWYQISQNDISNWYQFEICNLVGAFSRHLSLVNTGGHTNQLPLY